MAHVQQDTGVSRRRPILMPIHAQLELTILRREQHPRTSVLSVHRDIYVSPLVSQRQLGSAPLESNVTMDWLRMIAL